MIAELFKLVVVQSAVKAYDFARRHPWIVALLLLLAALAATVRALGPVFAIFGTLSNWLEGKDANGVPLTGPARTMRRAVVVAVLFIVPGAFWFWLAAKVFDFLRTRTAQDAEVTTTGADEVPGPDPIEGWN